METWLNDISVALQIEIRANFYSGKWIFGKTEIWSNNDWGGYILRTIMESRLNGK